MKYNFVKLLKEIQPVSKSRIFLYPVLNLSSQIDPINTYLGIKDMDLEKSLICLFHETQPGFKEWKSELLSHTNYEFDFKCDNGYFYVVFGFWSRPTYYDTIVQGQYSQIDNKYKGFLMQLQKPILNIALYPESFYDDFSEDLGIPVEILKAKRELLSPPDMETELISFTSKELNRLQEVY